MTETMAGGPASRGWRGRSRLAAVALTVAVAVLAAGCGGDGEEAKATSPAEAKALRAKYSQEGALPKLCRFLTVREVEDVTGMDVSESHEFPTQCAYYTPDKKGLVASVYAQRPGIVDYDDLEHTRDAEKQKGVEGADRAVFLAPFHIMAALKADIYFAVQLPAMRDESEGKVKDATRELLETALTRL